MREFRECGASYDLTVEALPVLQLCAIDEPLFPNLETLNLWGIHKLFIPVIPLVLSPRVTSIILGFGLGSPDAILASTVSSFPKLCPESQVIRLDFQGYPMITAAVSEMVLATNRNTLQEFDVQSSPLTEEASAVISKLPNLRSLSVVVERETSLSSALLPNLTELELTCDNGGHWPQLFQRATLGKLNSVTFFLQSTQIDNFLETFEKVALSSSVQNTLSEFHIFTSCSWNPNYPSLLPFTRLVHLMINLHCGVGCSSRVDDDIIINLSRAMPKLQVLQLGDDPCREITIGVTAKGLMALALHCPNLRRLRIHFQVASLITSPTNPGMTPDVEPTGSWTDCALTELVVGNIPVPEESTLMVTLTLLRIFPRIARIDSCGEEWGEVEDAIFLSKQIVKCSSR